MTLKDMETTPPSTLSALVKLLPSIPHLHQRGTPLHSFLDELALKEARTHFSQPDSHPVSLGEPLGTLDFPFQQMGNISSLHLFGLDELILFSYYVSQRHRYRQVLDLGANIGLHSIILSHCGYSVRAYEPDPSTHALLRRNLSLNQCTHVEPINGAVSTQNGKAEFVRVLGNLTGSHLAGAKTNSYGNLEKFEVKVDAFVPLLAWADFAKIDVEGHEAAILCTTSQQDWLGKEAMLEIGCEENAKAVFDHFQTIKTNLFSQMTGWKRVTSLNGMPKSYKDGSLFISQDEEMRWK